MKKLLYFFIGFVFFLLVAWWILLRALNAGSIEPDNTLWTAHIGRDTTVGILPDQYANYFTYTLARTNEDMGFKISGAFPDTRYFSFNVYSLGDNTTQGSLVDYQIKTDSGKPNPFLVNKDSMEVGNRYTVHILPANLKGKNLSNTLYFTDDVKVLLMVIRLYDFNIDDFGGVDYPTVEAFTMEEATNKQSPEHLPTALDLRTIVRNVSLPGMVKRLGLLYETENTDQLDGPKKNKKYTSLPFHAIDTKGYIENNDNRYLLAGITKKEDEVFVFKFKAPSYTTGPENINQTDVRYWSFNLGNAASYNFNALKDEDALLDAEGKVTIVMASKDVSIESRTKELGYNFLEWNMNWKEGLILFRHMLAHPDFEAQIDEVPPIIEGMSDFKSLEAYHTLGDYAPQGIRLSKEEFLTEYSVRATGVEVN